MELKSMPMPGRDTKNRIAARIKRRSPESRTRGREEVD